MTRLSRLILGKLTGLLWILGRKVYMPVRIWYFKKDGVVFTGVPNFIHPSARLDTLGGVTVRGNVTISADVFVLSHDYAITKGLCASGRRDVKGIAVFDPVTIGENCFVGLGAILLPGTVLGRDVIVGAGAVVRGSIPANSVVIGNPAIIVARTDEWALKCLDKKRDKLHYDKDAATDAILPHIS